MPLPYSLTVRPGHVSLMCHSCVLHCVDISAGEHFLQVLGFFEVFTCLFKCQCPNWLTKSSQSLQLHLLYLPAQYFSTPLVLTQWIVILVLAELTCEHLDKISVFFFFLTYHVVSFFVFQTWKLLYNFCLNKYPIYAHGYLQ